MYVKLQLNIHGEPQIKLIHTPHTRTQRRMSIEINFPFSRGYPTHM